MSGANYGHRTRATNKSATLAQHAFSMIPSANIERSVFNRSHGLKTAWDAGYLVPILCDEVLPGDTMSLRMAMFARTATPLYPVLDNLWVDVFFFFVPNRLLWSNWQKFCGEQTDPGDSIDYTVPQMTELVAAKSLSDFIGLPILNTHTFNSLHHRAYNLIYNEWFRSEDLQDSVVVDTDDGPDDPADYVLLRRGKRHDYFTSCLPWAQKGNPLTLPLGTTAPLQTVGDGIPKFDAGAETDFGLRANNTNIETDGADVDPAGDLVWNDPKLEVDLSNATAATINSIREAFQIQKLLERDARGGTRYTELLRSHFGVISPDQRLQRPEYLGGGSTRIQINPVHNVLRGTTPMGDLAAFGFGFSEGFGFSKSFVEHGVILGLVNVRTDLTYQQGIDRMFSRQTRYDYYWPALARIGEQAVLTKEIYATGVPAEDDVVFGYQERYAEYRYKPSRVTSLMRSDNGTSLDAWHYGLDFSSAPLLNSLFIQDFPPIGRTLATSGQAFSTDMIGDFWFEYRNARPLPVYGTPGLIDHL